MRAPLRFPPKRQKSAVGAGRRALKIFSENSLECTASKFRQGVNIGWGREGELSFSHFCQRRKCSLKLLADVNPPSDKRAWPYVIFFNHTKLNGLTLQDSQRALS